MATPFRRIQLSTRASLLVLVTAPLLPVAIFAALVVWRFAGAERARYQTAALYASERIAASVDRELSALETALQALSTGRSFGERAYDRFYERALEVKRIIGADVILKNADGQQLVNTRVPFGKELPTSLQPHEQRALELKKPQVSDLFTGAFSGRRIIGVSVPLLRDQGEHHLLTIAIEPERFGMLLQAQALPEGWSSGVIDGDGNVIARSQDAGRFTGLRVPSDIEGRLAGRSGTWEGPTRAGNTALMAFVRPTLAPGWRVAVAVPVSVASARLGQALVPVAIGGALALLATVLLALWIGGRAARDMARLARSAEALGTSRNVAPLATPIREINLVNAALVEAARDLDRQDEQRRAAEESLRRLNENLETAIVERSAQLVQLQKTEAVGQLTGGVAHDFNNLLMAILGSLELLEKRIGDDPRARRLLDNAVQGARRGAALTQRLLAFARRQELAPTAVDVPVLLTGMSDLLERSLGPSVELRLDLPASLPPALVDANQLELAVLNLAVNGRDAMAQGGRIVIEARTAGAEGFGAEGGQRDCVVVSVTDSGSGMDAETLRRATEPFFTTKGVGKGTGLGLSMVHGLAEQSGGRLAIRSEIGIGTTAELWLPTASEAVATGEPRLPRSARQRAEAIRVMIVDDDPLVLAGTAHLLEDLGHQVVEASSGRQALEILAAGARIDLLVTDYAMPAMNGIELIETIARTRPHMPAILASGYAEAASQDSGARVRLSKPFTQAALADALVEAQTAARRSHPTVLAFARK